MTLNKLSNLDIVETITKSSVSPEDIYFYNSVIILNCGGTIDMSGATERQASGKVEQELCRLKTELNKQCINIISYKIFERPPDSSNIGELEWEKIFEKINSIIQQKKTVESCLKLQGIKIEKGGIVITHGTDTLSFSSLAISLKLSLYEPYLPIIFTGSHTPIGIVGTDASDNLKKSIFAAKEHFYVENNNLLSGIYVLIGQDIHLASRISKVSTMPNSEGKYFFSFPAPVAQITSDKNIHIKIDREYLSRIQGTNLLKQNNVREIREWGIVEHLIIDKFTCTIAIEDFKRRVNFYRSKPENEDKQIGLIVQGNFSKNSRFIDIIRILDELSIHNVIIFLGSKEVFDKVKPLASGVRLNLLHKSLSHGKGRIKLSWLLKLNIDNEEIKKLMNTNIVGDIFETTALPEWINYETFPESIETVENIVIYPSIHYKVIDDAIERLSISSKRKKMFLYGFGDGHIPTGNKSINEIVQNFLAKEKIFRLITNFKSNSLKEIENYLINIIKTTNKDTIKNYFFINYKIDRKELKTILCDEISMDIKKQELQEVTKCIRKVLEQYQSKHEVNLKSNSVETLSSLILENIKLEISKNQLDTCISHYFNDSRLDLDSQHLIDKLIDYFPHLIAKRIMKDAIMNSNNLLSKIGNAVDKKIAVMVRTSAVKSKTNTSLYETGNILMILGVNSEEYEGWDTLYLTPIKSPLSY